MHSLYIILEEKKKMSMQMNCNNKCSNAEINILHVNILFIGRKAINHPNAEQCTKYIVQTNVRNINVMKQN